MMGQRLQNQRISEIQTKGEQAMHAHRPALVASLILIFTLIGCACDLKITSPPGNGQPITTPYDLKAEVTGCTYCEIHWFRVYLDGQDITSAFTFGSKECTASSYSLPLGSHMLRVEAEVYGSSFCRDADVEVERQFDVQTP
jgi:hypothetical protein